MEESVIYEIRQLMQELIVPELKSLAVKVDTLQHKIEVARKVAEAKTAAFVFNISAMRK